VPRPPRPYVEPRRERLLHPLHYPRQLEPVLRPDVERYPFAFKSESANLEGEEIPRLAEYSEEDRRRLPQAEEHLTVIDRRPYLVPHTLRQNSFQSHTVYMGLTYRFALIGREKNVKKW
jgi:hypothetical protein